MEKQKTLWVASGIVIRDGKILLLEEIKSGDLRMTPFGGKQKEGESIKETFHREACEELGVNIQILKKIGEFTSDSPEGSHLKFDMRFCRINDGEPEIQKAEKNIFSGLKWVGREAFMQYENKKLLAGNLLSAKPYFFGMLK